jgi:hypothetical protein
MLGLGLARYASAIVPEIGRDMANRRRVETTLCPLSPRDASAEAPGHTEGMHPGVTYNMDQDGARHWMVVGWTKETGYHITRLTESVSSRDEAIAACERAKVAEKEACE